MVEVTPKIEVGEERREVIHWLVKVTPKSEVGEERREVVHW